MSLHKLGFTAKTVSCRSKRAADSDLDTDRLMSKQTTSACSTEGDGNGEPTPLSDFKIKSRQSSYPWAVYVSPCATGHVWRCCVCDKSRKDVSPRPIVSRSPCLCNH
jgi:hypothetical protein